MKIATFLASLALLAPAPAVAESPPLEPVVHVYATRGDVELTAHVFTPAKRTPSRSAIVILHGGGWEIGDPTWGYGPARRLAAEGMVAVSGQYRLSGRKHPGVTPLDAMADARALVRWVRANHESLGIDPARVAAYGWSAGAHLIASAAIWHDLERDAKHGCVPDALILDSPAVSLHEDEWLAGLLGGRARVEDVSPDRHVRKGMPPTLLLQGRTDTLTTLAGTEAFHSAMLAAGNESELVVYDGVGHLFTPSTESDRGWPKPDPAVREAANAKMQAFLRARGFLSPEPSPD